MDVEAATSLDFEKRFIICLCWVPVATCRLSRCGVQASLPHGLWALHSPIRGQTTVPCIGRGILHHSTNREAPSLDFEGT